MKKSFIKKMVSVKNEFSLRLLKISIVLTTSPALAALPTIPVPTGGGLGGAAVQEGDFLGMMGGYFKLGLTILGTVIAALAFIMVVAGGLARWKKYSAGQMEISELKEYLIMGVVIMVFVVMMVKYAFETLA